MTITARKGKVIVRLRGRQCSLDPDAASKLGLALLDAGKKAAKQADALQEP